MRTLEVFDRSSLLQILLSEVVLYGCFHYFVYFPHRPLFAISRDFGCHAVRMSVFFFWQSEVEGVVWGEGGEDGECDMQHQMA